MDLPEVPPLKPQLFWLLYNNEGIERASPQILQSFVTCCRMHGLSPLAAPGWSSRAAAEESCKDIWPHSNADRTCPGAASSSEVSAPPGLGGLAQPTPVRGSSTICGLHAEARGGNAASAEADTPTGAAEFPISALSSPITIIPSPSPSDFSVSGRGDTEVPTSIATSSGKMSGVVTPRSPSDWVLAEHFSRCASADQAAVQLDAVVLTYSPLASEAHVASQLVGVDVASEDELLEAEYDGVTFDIGLDLRPENLRNHAYISLCTFADWLRARARSGGYRPIAISEARMLTATCKTWASLRPRMFRFSSYIAPRPRADDSRVRDPPSPIGDSVSHAAMLRAPFGVLSLAGTNPAGDALGPGGGLQEEGNCKPLSPDNARHSQVTPGGWNVGAVALHTANSTQLEDQTSPTADTGEGGMGGRYAASMMWRDPISDHVHDQEESETTGSSATVPVFGYLDSFAARSCPSKAHLPFYVNDLPGAQCDAFRYVG